MCHSWDYHDATEIITFDRCNEKGAWGVADDGIYVFVDRDMHVSVQVGEIWICRLCRNHSSESVNYWAWPID